MKKLTSLLLCMVLVLSLFGVNAAAAENPCMEAGVQAAAGTVIGHKRIVPLDGVRTDALRIRITDSRTAPTLRFAGVYA